MRDYPSYMAELTFEPPGPGTWQLDDLHHPRPLTRYNQDLPHGWNSDPARRALAKYGILTNFSVRIVNGFAYAAKQPVDGIPDPDGDPVTLADLPTDPENEFQRRVQNARETFETKRWRTDLTRWDNEWKPRIRQNNRRLQNVSPAELDDEELVEHLEACREAVIEHSRLIFRIAPCGMIPQSDFLAFVREHTDLSPAEVVPLFVGASPDSRGPVDELQTLVSTIETTPDARELVFSEKPPGDIIDQLGEFGGELGDAVADWLAVAGYRIMPGFDLDNHYALERPAALVNTLRAAIDDELDTEPNPGKSVELESVRQQIPAALRETFDERYADARLTYRVQDEREHRGLSTKGLLRRALLEAGRRLTDRSQLRNSEHVVDLKHDEVISALRGEPAPSAAEVAAHVRYRQNHDASDAPDQLGADESNPIDPETLPEDAARVLRALAARQWANNSSTGSSSDEKTAITGHGASPGVVEGKARVIDGSKDFDTLREGDILVTEITNSTFNFVLPLLEGIVTDTGGMLSHPAIVAREFDIPGVVGCEDATERIRDGDHIIVDGEAGTVRFADD